MDLFGEAKLTQASLEGSGASYRLEARLTFGGGAEVRLVEERGLGLERRTRWGIECEAGLLDDPPREPPGALFRRDLDCFLGRVAGTAKPYVSEERVLHVLGLVERIDQLCALS